MAAVMGMSPAEEVQAGTVPRTTKLGILHPGNMGISLAASAQKGGCEVYWASEGRSPRTRERAERFSLHDAGTLAELCKACSLIISVCPPHAAEDVAEQVLDRGFAGLYLDANAISPMRVMRISEKMTMAGVAFVDGGIVGGPAWEPGQTWLYLSGEQAQAVADCFSAGPLETTAIGEEIGKASALKMCYAAWTKGSTALLCAILATAEALGVWEELQRQWARDWPGFDEQAVGRVRRVTSKAWRFAGEMEEISATFEEAGLPAGFHAAAAELYRRIAHLKDAAETPALEDVLASLILTAD
jgi:3-hydroxyisobutyrate dehydrogenase-like beta-hydroxyacid dehydrogenase